METTTKMKGVLLTTHLVVEQALSALSFQQISQASLLMEEPILLSRFTNVFPMNPTTPSI
jgi:hypothetical protein